VLTTDEERSGPSQVAPPRSGLRLLREEPDFRRVYLSQLISLGGDWFAMIPLLSLLLKLTGSPLWGALVLAADTLMIAVFSPYAGSVVDRVDRRRLMVVCDIASAGFIALLFLVRTGSTAWIALVALGGVAAVKAFYGPAGSATLPNLVPSGDLLTANSLTGSIWGVMLAVGASLGATVATLLSTDWCFAIDVFSFCASAVLISRVRKPCGGSHGAPVRRRVRDDIKEAVRFARRDNRMTRLLACKPATMLGNGILAFFPALGASVFHVGAIGVGLLYAARGVGAVMGPLAARRLLAGQDRRFRYLTLLAMLTFGLAYVGFAGTTWFPLAVLLVVVAHIGGSMNATLSSYALQAATPDTLRGRVMSADFMFSTLSLGLSQLLAAQLSGLMAARPASLAIAGVVVAYAAAWFTFSGALRGRLPRAGV
jgi:MFS family permease